MYPGPIKVTKPASLATLGLSLFVLAVWTLVSLAVWQIRHQS